MRLENKKIYIEKEHDTPGFDGLYLYLPGVGMEKRHQILSNVKVIK